MEPRVVQYKETPEKTVKLGYKPRAVCVVNDMLHVAEQFGDKIHIHDMSGQHLSSYNIPDVYDVAATPDGQLVASVEDGVVLCDAAGNIVKQLRKYGSGTDAFDEAMGLTVDVDGTIYVCERSNNRIKFLNKTLTSIRHIQTMSEPWSVAVHPRTRDLYVIEGDHCEFPRGGDKIRVYGDNGAYKSTIRQKGRGSMFYISCSPAGLLCVSYDYGFIQLVDVDSGVKSLQQLHIPVEKLYIGLCGGTTFTSSGRLVACNTQNKEIAIFSRQ